MYTNSLMAPDSASIIQAERLAEDERTADKAGRPQSDDARTARPHGLARSERHLGSWLARAGSLVAGLSTDAAQGRRPALEAFVEAAMLAARRGGVDLGFTLEPGQPVVVLNRVMGVLAARTAAEAVPVFRSHRVRLDAALRALTDNPTPDSGWELAAEVADVDVVEHPGEGTQAA